MLIRYQAASTKIWERCASSHPQDERCALGQVSHPYRTEVCYIDSIIAVILPQRHISYRYD
jgi:hypothetical protein